MSERAAGAAETLPAGGDVGLPGPAVAAGMLVALVALFAATGSYAPDAVPGYAESRRQITGMALMLTFMPPYLVVAAWIAQRRSLALVAESREHLAEPAAADDAVATIRTGLRGAWLPGTAIGLVMGLLNTEPWDAIRGPAPVVASAISLGQLHLWWVVGMLLVVRIATARAFRRLSEVAHLDLLRPDRLKPIARAGVIDVVVIAGALLFTPLQSLDAEFRWYNYHFGLLVALPASAFFLVWPVLPLHRRNRAERDARLAAVDRQISGLGRGAADGAEATARLEALLAHRHRLRGANSWPLGTAILSRVVFYLVIPPLAWAGAALVERVVDALLSP